MPMNSMKEMRDRLLGKTVRAKNETAIAVINDVYRKGRQNFFTASYYGGSLNVEVSYSQLKNGYYIFVD